MHSLHKEGGVDKLNALTKDTPQAQMGLESLIQNADGGVFNNAAQVFNHTFYWLGLGNPGSTPSVELDTALTRTFGSRDDFIRQFTDAAKGLFGSGWTWLTYDRGNLVIETTGNADNPIHHGKRPLFTIDVWEHAYYLDYQNNRPGYLEAIWKIVDWDFISENLAKASDTATGPDTPCLDVNNPVCAFIDAIQDNERVPT